MPWSDYVTRIEQGPCYGDLLLMIAFSNIYSITIICVTDEEMSGNRQLDIMEYVPCCFSVEPRVASSRFAVIGTTGGRTFHALLPAHFYDALTRSSK